MFSDGQKLQINGDRKDMLFKAIEFALEYANSKVVSYKVEGDKITFYWYAVEGAYPLPPTKNFETISNMTWDHLQSDEAQAAGEKRDDIDGTIRKGWEIFIPQTYIYQETEHNRTYKDPQAFYAIFAVKFAWMYYGK